MAQVVADITGTTATGRPSSAGSSYCSTEAKYELKSTNRQRRVMAEPDIAPVSEYLAPESQGRAMRLCAVRVSVHATSGGGERVYRTIGGSPPTITTSAGRRANRPTLT